MKFNVISHFEWLKAITPGYKDLASSGIHGPERLADLGIETGDLPLSGGNPYGYPPLKKWLADRFGVGVNQIALAQGASGANFALMASLVGESDQVVLESPVYQPMVSVVESLSKLSTKFFHRNLESNYQIDPEEVFRAHPNPKLIVTTNLHNPSGKFQDPNAFVEIAERTESTGGYLLIDEIFRPFMSDWNWHSAATLHDRIITTGSLTKAWGLGGLRVGWIIGPPDIIYRVQRLLDYTQGVQSVFNEALGLRLLESGVASQLLDVARTRAFSNRKAVSERLRAWGKLDYVAPDGGIVLYARHPEGKSTFQFCQTLYDKHKIVITPGHYFRDDSGFRIGMGADTENVNDWLDLLIETFDQEFK